MRVTLALAASLLIVTGAAAQAPSTPVLKIGAKATPLALGGTLDYYLHLSGAAPGATVEVYLGNPLGQSSVMLGGSALMLPLGNAALAYQAPATNGAVRQQLTIPNDPSFLGTQLRLQAVLIQGSSVFLAAPTHSGPIIEDSIQ